MHFMIHLYSNLLWTWTLYRVSRIRCNFIIAKVLNFMWNFQVVQTYYMYVSKRSLSWGSWSQQWTVLGLILRKNDLFMIIYRLQVQASFNGWFEKKRKDNLQFWFWNWNNCQLCFQFSHPRADPDFCKRDANFASLVTALCLDILCCGYPINV